MNALKYFEPKSCRIKGAQDVVINVWDYGGDGPSLVLNHGTGLHGRIWDPIVKKVAADFRIISIDTRGHGLSEKPPVPEAYFWPNSGLDILAAIDAMNLAEPIIGVGHSAGGTHVLYAELERPAVFSNVLVIEPGIVPTPLKEAARSYNLSESARRRTNEFSSRSAARERLSSKPPKNSWKPEFLEAYLEFGLDYREDGSATLRCPPEIEAMILDQRTEGDLYERLPEIATPITLVTGENTFLLPFVPTVVDRFSAVNHVVVGGAGHFVPQEEPDAIARLIGECASP